MKKVILVDDLATNRKALGTLLGHAGYDVRLAVDAADALRQFAEERPDVVMTDLQMPGDDGVALARALRAQECGDRVRIALLTGDAGKMDERNGWDVFDAVLSKPVTLADMVAFLEKET